MYINESIKFNTLMFLLLNATKPSSGHPSVPYVDVSVVYANSHPKFQLNMCTIGVVLS